MSTKRPYIGPSESQANAEALARRGSPYSAASDMSFKFAYDYHRREPSDLREAVRMVRRAYEDEVPTKLHEGPDSIGEGGTPKMTARAEGYLFGRHDSDDAPRDAETGQRDPLGYYHAPFRAKLAEMQRGDEGTRARGRIVSHVTIGSQGPGEAAQAEGVPAWCAKLVAEDALRSFLRQLTDIKLHIRRQQDDREAAVAV